MNIENLYVGLTFKNYNDMCNILEIAVKKGMNSKEAQFKELAQFCKFEKTGHKITVVEIYETPIPKIDNRGLSYGSRNNRSKYDPIIKTHPHLIDEWDANKNNVNIDVVTKCSTYNAWWICKKCNHHWQTSVEIRANLNRGCPICNSSKGERKISEFFKKYKILFEPQFKFGDLRGINNGELRFDFIVYKDDHSIDCLIEYDGQYHFKVINDDIYTYNRIVEHDKRKNEYCKLNNIKLIRIPYTHFDIVEDILALELNVPEHSTDLHKKSKKSIINYYEWKINNLQMSS